MATPQFKKTKENHFFVLKLVQIFSQEKKMGRGFFLEFYKKKSEGVVALAHIGTTFSGIFTDLESVNSRKCPEMAPQHVRLVKGNTAC